MKTLHGQILPLQCSLQVSMSQDKPSTSVIDLTDFVKIHKRCLISFIGPVSSREVIILVQDSPDFMNFCSIASLHTMNAKAVLKSFTTSNFRGLLLTYSPLKEKHSVIIQKIASLLKFWLKIACWCRNFFAKKQKQNNLLSNIIFLGHNVLCSKSWQEWPHRNIILPLIHDSAMFGFKE